MEMAMDRSHNSLSDSATPHRPNRPGYGPRGEGPLMTGEGSKGVVLM